MLNIWQNWKGQKIIRALNLIVPKKSSPYYDPKNDKRFSSHYLNLRKPFRGNINCYVKKEFGVLKIDRNIISYVNDRQSIKMPRFKLVKNLIVNQIEYKLGKAGEVNSDFRANDDELIGNTFYSRRSDDTPNIMR